LANSPKQLQWTFELEKHFQYEIAVYVSCSLGWVLENTMES